MSRIGKLPVILPSGVSATLTGSQLTVKGPKGELSLQLPPAVKLEQREQELVVSKKQDTRLAAQQYGLTRSLVANLVQGVSEGFSRNLEIQGVGYRAQVSGQKMTLSLGYSHEIVYQLPPGVEAKVEGNVISLSGIDKQTVGQAAAHIRALRKPEPYKGKGIRYQDEQVRRKAGKAASK